MKKQWKKIPDSEIERLDKTFVIHLRSMKIKYTKPERISKIKKILEIQKYTCAFADGDPSYCWNHVRDKELDYVKLEWGHKIPRSHGEIAHKEDNLILLCARCNNHIQSSRTIEEIIPELEHKLKALKKLK